MLPRPLRACVVLLLFPYFLLSDLTGSVFSILGGGTIEVLHNLQPERIRLNGIDCPEKRQAYGK
jgi:endonuclease YncB( thermonuclease family)